MRHRTLRILWFALLLSQVIYLAIPLVVTFAGPPADPSETRQIGLALAVTAVVIAIGTLVYRRRALVIPIQSGHFDPNTPEGFKRVFTPFVLNLALTESIAIYGFVLAVLSRDARPAIPFALAAFFLMYLHRPTASDLSPPQASGGSRPRPIG